MLNSCTEGDCKEKHGSRKWAEGATVGRVYLGIVAEQRLIVVPKEKMATGKPVAIASPRGLLWLVKLSRSQKMVRPCRRNRLPPRLPSDNKVLPSTNAGRVTLATGFSLLARSFDCEDKDEDDDDPEGWLNPVNPVNL